MTLPASLSDTDDSLVDRWGVYKVILYAKEEADNMDYRQVDRFRQILISIMRDIKSGMKIEGYKIRYKGHNIRYE